MPSGWFPILAGVRIGLLGGTFDPPHIAHLHTGEVAFRQLGLDLVVFMPAGAPWQKAGRQVSAPEHRWAMTELALGDVDYFRADDREVHRDGWTFTADTVSTFETGTEVALILGADAAAKLPTWHRADEVIARVELAVAPRPGTVPAEVEDAISEDLASRTTWLDMASIDLSGTLIRERVASGRSVRFLVPDPVWAYFIDRRLYATDSAAPVA